MTSSENINKEFFEFISKNQKSDIINLLLKSKNKKYNFPIKFAVIQIECRRKCNKKLSDFLRYQEFLFPDVVSAEQSSHQAIGYYHSSIIGNKKNVLDMTGGLGIDSFCIALASNRVTTIELNPDKYKTLLHNAKVLDLDQIKIYNDDSIEYLKKQKDTGYDWIFIDPSRRSLDNSRLYAFSECQPDVITNFELLLKFSDNIAIKASPMLDVTHVLKELPDSNEIHLVHIDGECKEVLILVQGSKLKEFQSRDKDRKIKIVNISNKSLEKNTVNNIILEWEIYYSEFGNTNIFVEYQDLKEGTFLYDPLAGLHKINSGKKLSLMYKGLKRLSPNTDLFWSDKLYDNFPGRIFKIKGIPDKNRLHEHKGKTASVIVRNYVMSAEKLQIKYKLKADDKRFIVGCRLGVKEKPILLEVARELD